MKLELYAIYNETQKQWWAQGHPAYEPCKPYLWSDKKKANKKLAQVSYFYGWDVNGDTVKIVTFCAEVCSK